MTRRSILTVLCSFLVAFGVAIGFRLVLLAPPTTQSGTLLIAAAASLQNALEDIDPLFESAYPQIKVNYNFAASGTLQQQIEQGAPVDLFISAATRQMDALQDKKLILTSSRRNVLTNRLVLVVPRHSNLGLTDFGQLTNAKFKHISMGEPRSVPAGQYAEEVFRNLGIWDRLQPKLVFGNSVRNVLGAVEAGNADAGIVYATDARMSDQVTSVATAPSHLHSPMVYPLAIVSASRHQDAARLYTQFLRGEQALGVFRESGFGIASN